MRPRRYQPGTTSASDGKSKAYMALSQPLMRLPRRLGQSAEHREHQRLAVEVVVSGVARRIVDLLERRRDASKTSRVAAAVAELRRQPAVDRIHEGRQRLGLAAGALI